MTRQKLIPEEGSSFRKEEINGAIVTAMGIVKTEKYGYNAYLDTDDGLGIVTYPLSVKGSEELALIPADDGCHVGGSGGMLTAFNRFNKALLKLGYEPYTDPETLEWGTEPTIIGQPIWVKLEKTGTATDGTEYKSLIDVVKIGADGTPPAAKGEGTPKEKVKPAAKGTLTPELIKEWTGVLGKVLTEPMNNIGINAAVKKMYPDEPTGKNAAHRKMLADTREKALTALLLTEKNPTGILELNEDGKYQLAA